MHTAISQLEASHPFTLGNGHLIPNRLFKSAMSEVMGDRNRAPTQRLIRLYETWGKGGAGLLVTGNVMIDPDALGEPGNVVLADDRHLEAFRCWATAARKHGSQVWMQLNHPGKQSPSYLSPLPVAPSAIPLGKGLEKVFNTPRALTEIEILDLVDRFANSAALAKEAGFTGVQIHGAHGYLVSQFLSPHHNRREDKWGGSLENRARFVLSVYHAIRERVGVAFPIGIKLNSADFQRGGFSEEDSRRVVEMLSAAGIDLIEISGGNYENPEMMSERKTSVEREAFFLEYANSVRAVSSVPLVVTGGFRSAAGMRQALRSGATDLIGLARPLAVVPDLPKRLFADPDYQIKLKNPTTGFPLLDRLTVLSITYYENQLARIGSGKAPKPDMNAWEAALKTLASTGIQAFRPRRASVARG